MAIFPAMGVVPAPDPTQFGVQTETNLPALYLAQTGVRPFEWSNFFNKCVHHLASMQVLSPGVAGTGWVDFTGHSVLSDNDNMCRNYGLRLPPSLFPTNGDDPTGLYVFGATISYNTGGPSTTRRGLAISLSSTPDLTGDVTSNPDIVASLWQNITSSEDGLLTVSSNFLLFPYDHTATPHLLLIPSAADMCAGSVAFTMSSAMMSLSYLGPKAA